ncbi:protein SPMIP2 [Lissotriton helveticus]
MQGQKRISGLYSIPHRLSLPSTPGHRILFTAPDGVGDYRTRRYDFTAYIGDTEPSPESTTSVEHLTQAPSGTFEPRPKCQYPGEIGWNVEEHLYLNRANLLSDMQIKRKEFRQASEDRVTHRYQNPWYPSKQDLQQQEVKYVPGQAQHQNYNRSGEMSASAKTSGGHRT